MILTRREIVCGAAALGLAPAATAAPLGPEGARDASARLEVVVFGDPEISVPLMEGAQAFWKRQGKGPAGFRRASSLVTGGDGSPLLLGRGPLTLLAIGSNADLLFGAEAVRDAGGAIIAMAHGRGNAGLATDADRLRRSGAELARRAIYASAAPGEPPEAQSIDVELSFLIAQIAPRTALQPDTVQRIASNIQNGRGV